jgi:hypothetical protein
VNGAGGEGRDTRRRFRSGGRASTFEAETVRTERLTLLPLRPGHAEECLVGTVAAGLVPTGRWQDGEARWELVTG